jgi:hypothetical protein
MRDVMISKKIPKNSFDDVMYRQQEERKSLIDNFHEMKAILRLIVPCPFLRRSIVILRCPEGPDKTESTSSPNECAVLPMYAHAETDEDPCIEVAPRNGSQ